MYFEDAYERNKAGLLKDPSICSENRTLFRNFFEFEEYKLKRTNGLSKIDERSYKTLVAYVPKLRNVNRWFKNKPWSKLTEAEIKKVFDDLEDGRILNCSGEPFKDKRSYYNKIFKSKPFELAGKAGIAKEVMAFHSHSQEEVRFIEEDAFRKLVEVSNTVKQKLLLWLAFDIGENINSLLVLKKTDFVRQRNQDNQEFEYIVNLPREILKRSRKSRSEITNFKETVQLLDMVLPSLKSDELLFNFEHRQALKFLDRAVGLTEARCLPKGQKVCWKDLRSSMACHLLKKGWSTDEIRARLGHAPSSKILDKYVNYLAIDRHAQKKKIHDSDIARFKHELEESKEREKLLGFRIMKLQEELQCHANDIQALKPANECVDRLLKNPQFRKMAGLRE